MSTTADISAIARPAEPVSMEAAPVGRPDRASRSLLQQAVVDTWSKPTARAGVAWISMLVFLAVFAPFLANSRPVLMKTAEGISSPMLKALGPSDVLLLVLSSAGVALALVRGIKFSTKLALFAWIFALAIPLTLWPWVQDEWSVWAASKSRIPIFGGLALGAIVDLVILLSVPLQAAVPRRGWISIGIATAALAALLIALPIRPPQIDVGEEYRQMQRAGKILWVITTPIPYSPRDRNRDAPAGEHPAQPSAKHWLGTEQNGADMLSQMIHASRVALSVGFVATGIAVIIGIVIGGLMGYFAGAVDLIGYRLIEIFQAIPRLLLLLTVAGLVSKNIYVIMVVIGLTGWTFDARLIRAEFLKLRKQDFVQAATASGLPLHSILFRHMLPNGIAPVLVSASFGVAAAILLEATLSFLGLGDPDQPSWGQLLNQTRSGGAGFHWWIAIFPGLAIFLTVFSYNLIGEAIRDAIDPKLRKRD